MHVRLFLVVPLLAVALSSPAPGRVPAPRSAPEVDTARTLDRRELANAVALARLLGVVRWFHPADEAAGADWDSLGVAAMRAVLPARDGAELARRLTSAIAPVAAGVSIGRQGDTAPRLSPPAGAAAVSWWVHDGVRLSARAPVYRSARARLALAAGGALPDSVPDPRRPHRVELGDGLVAWVPVAVWADGERTHPVASQRSTGERWRDSLAHAAARRAGAVHVPADRATRLASVALAWGMLDHFYPYFDLVAADWDAELSRALRAAASAGDACAQRDVLRRMVAALQDGHGNVVHDCVLQLRPPRARVDRVEGRIVVTAVGDGVPGIHVGDAVTSIDGAPVAARITQLDTLVSSPTAQWRTVRVMQELLVGPQGQSVRLGLERIDGTRTTVTLPRDGDSRRAPDELRPQVVQELRPALWYVDATRITTAEWNAALPRLQRARGLVIDMRGYPSQLESEAFLSHLVDSTIESARWLVPHQSRPRVGPRAMPLPVTRRPSWRITPGVPHLAAPKVFLTDGRAISYAESLMGIVEAYRIGAIVGDATAGTNGNVNPFALPGGYQVIWTGMRVVKHDGSAHHGVGIRPTVPVARTRAGVAAGRDEVLERALALLSPPGA